MAEQDEPMQPAAYEPPAIADLPTGQPSSVCAMIVISPTE
jgi:hypothetical protein